MTVSRSAASTALRAVALADAAEYPHARPWYRAVFADGTPVGFVMVSWNVEPQPPEIIGPWFLWKLLIDKRHQGRGYGGEVVRQVAELVRAQGATELLTSYVPQAGGPAGFYERLGFVPTGDRDVNGFRGGSRHARKDMGAGFRYESVRRVGGGNGCGASH